MSHEGIRIGSKESEESEQPLARVAVTPAKVRVLLSTGKGLEIDWEDGHQSAWSFAWLREACPCATCIDERTKEGRKPGQPKPKAAALLQLYVPPVKPTSAEPVGRYALQFHWNDGHSSGIYSWEYLRRSCQCGQCTLAATKTSGQPN